MLLGLVLVAVLSTEVEARRNNKKKNARLHAFGKRSSCPNDCSGHGQCSSKNVCNCFTGYAGDDCSVADSAADFGTVYNGHLSRQQWQYYHIDVPTGLSAISVQANQSADGDCDLYLRAGSYPSKAEFDYRDNTLTYEMALSVQNPSSGLWYAGVYGFQPCDYTFAVYSSNAGCDCSGHGSCNGASNCTCDAGWYGNKCQNQIRELTKDIPLSDSVSQRQWKYFVYRPTTHNNLLVVVNQTGGDSDLYVKYGKFPTFGDYDAKDVSLGENYALLVNNVQYGDYFIGMFGYQNSNFQITVRVSTDCPNLCSQHGTCSGDTCRCNSGFSGLGCETYVPSLTYDETISGFVYPQAWNYFHIATDTNNDLTFKVTQLDKGDDCDIYVKNGQNPTRFQYDYLNVGFGVTSTIKVTNPGKTNWYIGVLGYKSCTFNLTASIDTSSDCSVDCGDHGTCTNGRCVCDENYFGETCQYLIGSLPQNGASASASVVPNSWVYYLLPNSTSSVSNIYMKEDNTAGVLRLYSAFGYPPTERDFNNMDNSSAANHHIYLTNPSNDAKNIYVGVYATVNGPSTTDRVKFHISAFQTTF